MKRILDLIKQGEGDQLDFKREISSSIRIAKSLSAFANHKGGTLLVGVNDNGTIAGVKVEEEKFMLEQAAVFFCKPETRLKPMLFADILLLTVYITKTADPKPKTSWNKLTNYAVAKIINGFP